MTTLNLSQTEFATEKELQDYIQKLVIEYTSQSNELEVRMHKKMDPEGKNLTELFEAFHKEYFPLFQKYCTDKKRSYGGHGYSFRNPPTFNGIENATETTVILKTKSRAEVFFATQTQEKAQYLIIVLRKNGVWRIDNAKYKWYGEEKWDNLIL